jgi:hypothetical protein
VALPEGVRLVVVTKGEEQESVTRVAELAPPGVTVVLSTQAWLDYEVPMAPYFILVDGPERRVRGEGAASSWPQLVDLLGQALDDGAASRRAGRGAPKPVGAAERESLIDRELSAAGITPGDPSLYPTPPRSAPPPAPMTGPLVVGLVLALVGGCAAAGPLEASRCSRASPRSVQRGRAAAVACERPSLVAGS